MPELVEARREGAVCVLTLNRPEKLNALSSAVEGELLAALESEKVRESGALVVAGAGRAFSAGADISEFAGGPEEAVAYYRGTGDVYERVAALPQPTFAGIHGYCLGGALELALALDFRIADETAVFGFPEVELGVLPSSGGLHRLVRLVGPARAKELMLLRPRFTPAEGLAWGLVTAVVPAGEALSHALELAERAAALPGLAASVTKQAANLAAEASREAAILVERLAYAALAQTEEARAAAEAFTRRRG